VATGYQPWSALSITDPVYGSFSIAVATSVTDTDLIALRRLGSTVSRRGGVTQVAPLHTADTVHAGSVVTTSGDDFNANGGYNGATGLNTVHFTPGVYYITSYDTGGAVVAAVGVEVVPAG